MSSIIRKFLADLSEQADIERGEKRSERLAELRNERDRKPMSPDCFLLNETRKAGTVSQSGKLMWTGKEWIDK